MGGTSRRPALLSGISGSATTDPIRNSCQSATANAGAVPSNATLDTPPSVSVTSSSQTRPEPPGEAQITIWCVGLSGAFIVRRTRCHGLEPLMGAVNPDQVHPELMRPTRTFGVARSDLAQYDSVYSRPPSSATSCRTVRLSPPTGHSMTATLPRSASASSRQQRRSPLT